MESNAETNKDVLSLFLIVLLHKDLNRDSFNHCLITIN